MAIAGSASRNPFGLSFKGRQRRPTMEAGICWDFGPVDDALLFLFKGSWKRAVFWILDFAMFCQSLDFA